MYVSACILEVVFVIIVVCFFFFLICDVAIILSKSTLK